MKKRNIVLLTAAVLLAMTGCSENTNEISDVTNNNNNVEAAESDNTDETVDNSWLTAEPYDYMANDLSGFIKVGEYKGLTVTRESDILTDEEFENEIAVLLDNYAYYEEYTDRVVEDGDTVLADYSGYRDGVQFEGGTAENTTLTAAAGTGYIEGFAEAFIGKTPGEEFSFDVTFPESHDNADLAGVEVTFKCTVNAILGNELITPELTDEFVQENFGYSNTEEFRIAYRSAAEEQKKQTVENDMYTTLWLQVVDNSEVIAYPEEEVNRLYSQQCAMYEQYAAQFGTDYETFLKSYLNITDEDVIANSRSYVMEDLVMYQLVKDLGIELSDAEYTEGVEAIAASSGLTKDELISYYGEETLYSTVIWQKLMDVIAAEATIVEE